MEDLFSGQTSTTMTRRATWKRPLAWLLCLHLIACNEGASDKRNGGATSDKLQYTKALSRITLCQCAFGQWPADMEQTQVIQCITDRLTQADLTVAKVDLFDSKKSMQVLVDTGFETFSFETTFFGCSHETFVRIPASSIIAREPDNPDDWLASKEYDIELGHIIHSYVYAMREDSIKIFEPVFLNERPRRSRIVFDIRQGSVSDTLTFSEHRAEHIDNIRELLRKELEGNPKLRHDTGRIIVTVIYYEHDQLRSSH